MKVSDKWDLHFKNESSSRMEEGESSSSQDMEVEAPEVPMNQAASTTS